jgi:hypothetical protein
MGIVVISITVRKITVMYVFILFNIFSTSPNYVWRGVAAPMVFSVRGLQPTEQNSDQT